MPYVDTEQLLQHAHARNYCIGSFNVSNMEKLQAVIETAEENNSPVLVQAWAGLFRMDWVSMETLAAMVKSMGDQVSIPVSLHLDHGESFEEVVKSIRAGFSSVMIDASEKSLEENISLTGKVVELSHAAGVSVEAELGHVSNGEGGEGDDTDLLLTDPEEALYFVEETNVDYLAVSIGTVHGVYESEPDLDIERLKQIEERVDVPLVLHGSSYLPDIQVEEARDNGIDKVNIATEVDDAMVEGIRGAISESESPYATELTGRGKEKMAAKIEEKLELFNSVDKAW